MLGRAYGQIKEELNLGMGDARGDGRGNNIQEVKAMRHLVYGSM